MTKVLVTGTSGFIGSNLAPKLIQRGYDVVGLERYVVGRQFEGALKRVVYADLNDHVAVKQIIQQEQPEIVIHLAALSPVAYSYAHWSEVLKTNFDATANLAELCRLNIKNFRQFIFAGTSEEYGQQRNFPIKESADLRPNSPYAVSKAAADKYLRMLHDAYGFPVTIIRPFNSYGRSGNVHFVTEKIISQMLQGASTIKLGAFDPVRDFLYVDDHVEGYLKAVDNSRAVDRAFNICTGVGISIKDYVAKISSLIDWRGNVEWNSIPERPNDIYCLIGDNSKAKEILGWTPRYSLDEGLQLTIERLRSEMKCPIAAQN